ncbi:hypothetical protein J6590_009980 [Homalodisca vitripennis]|nr:hypothetical protein J6590_009980 [Homalodisca vitripennis]
MRRLVARGAEARDWTARRSEGHKLGLFPGHWLVRLGLPPSWFLKVTWRSFPAANLGHTYKQAATLPNSTEIIVSYCCGPSRRHLPVPQHLDSVPTEELSTAVGHDLGHTLDMTAPLDTGTQPPSLASREERHSGKETMSTLRKSVCRCTGLLRPF